MENLTLAETVRQRRGELGTLPVVTGFDGFVDEMISVVGTRATLDSFQRIDSIPAFAQAVAAAAGRSSLREIVIHESCPGGCAINMGDGLISLGVPVHTFATAGHPVHAAFADYADKATLTSWGREPGRTLAFEFSDGKLMFSSVEPLGEFTPDALQAYLENGTFKEACGRSRLIALTDWTLYPHMTSCWRFLIETVFQYLDDPVFFFDLVDPSSRTEADILDMASALREFASLGETTLGVNQNEADILCRVHRIAAIGSEPESAKRQADVLRKELGLQRLVLHASRYAVNASPEETVAVQGPYCEQPRQSTGAGDRFNAGWALGRILDVSSTNQLRLGTACSGYFVREGRSADAEELVSFLETHAIPSV